LSYSPAQHYCSVYSVAGAVAWMAEAVTASTKALSASLSERSARAASIPQPEM